MAAGTGSQDSFYKNKYGNGGERQGEVYEVESVPVPIHSISATGNVRTVIHGTDFHTSAALPIFCVIG